ncbi:hypothetical protein ACODYM_29165 [Burkholderia gladioli]|uniref:hypothetical protein n=1 Tax=Burkholderia gladioli TaxID=28095 RepID=UPI003B5067F2
MNANRYPQCTTCVNQALDPFECRTCRNGSNHDAGDVEGDELVDSDVMTVVELRELLED